MSVSLNSTNDSTTAEAIKELAEEVADLSQNHDEIVDLELALGALGGLRHSAACSAAERSTARFDERNHRLHESRMKSLGMEGEEQKQETGAEDMSHQVLIRSPTTHNHYSERPTNQPATPATIAAPPAPATPPVAKPGFSNLATAAIASGILASGLGAGVLGTYLMTRPKPAAVAPDQDKDWGLNLLPPDKRAP